MEHGGDFTTKRTGTGLGLAIVPGHITSLTKPYEFDALLEVLDGLNQPSPVPYNEREL